MKKKIRLGLVGVGNCASSLVQGLYYYTSAKVAEETGGLMHYEVGGYTPGDIEVVAAFDIDEKKIGKDVSEAIFEWPNCWTAHRRICVNTTTKSITASVRVHRLMS
jgi:myo-inositol-1-phosphate synthase